MFEVLVRAAPSARVLLVTGMLAVPAMAADYEEPVTLKASEVVSAEFLGSELYKVDPKVVNDGFMNLYQVESRFGKWEVSSTNLLGVRLNEIRAMVEMQKIDENDLRKDAAGDDVNELKEGATQLVNDPQGALEGAASGVKKMFKLGGEAWASHHTREDENKLESAGKLVVGYDKAKRELAGQLGVDPYSTNPDLQKELDRLATAASQGSAATMLAKAFIPGGLGLVVSATSMSQALNELVITSSETELRIINRDKLTAMNIDPELIELFLDDSKSTATQKTYITGSLENMTDTKWRENFIAHAIGPPADDVAMFRVRSATMYAQYHEEKAKIDRFELAGNFAFAVDVNNALVVQAPVDHLLWTPELESVLQALESAREEQGNISDMLIWISGTASDVAADEIERRGWSLNQHASR
jgi:hypothetical protein